MEALLCACACGCGQPVRIVKYPKSQQQPRFRQGHQHGGENNGNFRGGKVRSACPVCLGEVLRYPSAKRVTCGADACYRTWQRLTTAARGRNLTTVPCDHCGTELRLYPSQVNRFNFCNRFCQSQHHSTIIAGVNNGRWQGGRWSYVQEQTRIRDGHACAICGFDLATDVHHITPRSAGGADSFDNLITLCPNHHRLADQGIISVEHLRNTTWTPEAAASRHPGAASR